jgi:hypothetical protein
MVHAVDRGIAVLDHPADLLKAIQGPGAPGCVSGEPPLATESGIEPSAQKSWVILSSLTDEENLAARDFCDVTDAWIEQEGGLLRFVIQVRGTVPSTLALADDGISFIWLVDADLDPATGQSHGDIGSDFNLRAVISENFGGGFVDVTGAMPGGGVGSVDVTDARIELTVGLSQIGSPQSFDWRCGCFETIEGVPGVGNGGLTITASADTMPPPPPPAEVHSMPPLLMLSPSGPSTGHLMLETCDEDGWLTPTDVYHPSFFGPAGSPVAAVDDMGVVTATGVPIDFADTPYMGVSADGVMSANRTVVRSTNVDLDVEHRLYEGLNVAFFLPESIEGVDLHCITTDYQVVSTTDVAYRFQEAAVDGVPFDGGTQFLVLDVTDDGPTCPCGLSGNPVRLGWRYGAPVHNSCYIVNDPPEDEPQFFVIFHEIGHNFTWASQGFAQFASAASSQEVFVYSEGLASLAAMWSAWALTSCHQVADTAGAVEVADQFNYLKNHFLGNLADYQVAGADYEQIDPNIVDGVFYDLLDRFGIASWYDFFSLFAPADEPLPCSIEGVEEQATLVAAAFSASIDQDLRALFSQEYGFPIDDEAWPDLLACAQQRIDGRTFDLDTICAAATAFVFRDGFDRGGTDAWSFISP